LALAWLSQNLLKIPSGGFELSEQEQQQKMEHQPHDPHQPLWRRFGRPLFSDSLFPKESADNTISFAAILSLHQIGQRSAGGAKTSTHERPAQFQTKQPGEESQLRPKPEAEGARYQGCGKLAGRVALVTGGDSGIGRAVSVAFAKEGADVAIVYLSEEKDAQETKQLVEKENRDCILIPGDLGESSFCGTCVEKVLGRFGRLDILVNNAGEQHPHDNLTEITDEQLHRVFRTNIFSFFYLTRAALPYLKAGASIINTSSVTAYEGNPTLIDYAATKGAIVAFTRSLSLNLAKRKIRVNAVAPGPIWTPLIPASFAAEKVASFGGNTPMGRAGQPDEVAPSYVFLASEDASYITGQVLHPNGGRIVNG